MLAKRAVAFATLHIVTFATLKIRLVLDSH
jgi:hypothetical protein